MRIAVTGRPGVGKTTLCLKVYEALKDNTNISGFITREVRDGGRRIGFRLCNLSTGEEVWLARVGEGKVRVGKYAVFLNNFEKFLDGIDVGDITIIDEVGPMELKSRRFVEFVENIMGRDGLLFTVHYRSKHWLIEKIRKQFSLYILDEFNRDKITEEVIKALEETG
ncbi:NTPase [Archaeoglobus neptunius]|uniref:NTPase n=1 Tax=Archaeoglobus neptunius TaxID=2798580 RepID=UPI001926CBB2